MNFITWTVFIIIVFRQALQGWFEIEALKVKSVYTKKTWASSLFVIIPYAVILVFFIMDALLSAKPFPVISEISTVLILSGSVIYTSALFQLGKSYSVAIAVTEEFQLVTVGIYSLVRHPLRLGLALEGLGMSLFFGRFYLLPVCAVMIIIQIIRSKQEEKFLNEFLDGGYEIYKKRVPGYNIFMGVYRKFYPK